MKPRYRATPADIRDLASKTSDATSCKLHNGTTSAEPIPDDMRIEGRAIVHN
jgi:hypothetical protein